MPTRQYDNSSDAYCPMSLTRRTVVKNGTRLAFSKSRARDEEETRERNGGERGGGRVGRMAAKEEEECGRERRNGIAETIVAERSRWLRRFRTQEVG